MDSGICVLHVDDGSDFADLTRTILEDEHDRFSVETAPDAGAGLERLETAEFDCVVSDYDMPDENGIAFLEAVRAEYPALPFILFTGKGSEEIASDAISAGVTDYLQKGGGTDQFTVLANRIENAVERYRAEQRLERQNDLFEKAQDIADVGAWEFDPDSGTLRWTEKVYEIHGLAPGKTVSPSDSIGFYHPDDRSKIREAFERAVEEGQSYDHELRLIDADSEVKWVRTRGEPQYDDGPVVRVRGTIQDITDRKEDEQLRQIILDISSRLIDAGVNEIDEQIHEALATIGAFEGADRCYVFQVSEHRDRMDNTHEWCAEGVDSQQDELRNVPTESFSWFMPQIEAFEPVTVPAVSDLPLEAETLRETLESGNVESIVTIPLRRADELVGFIGLDWVEKREPWSEDTTSLLEVSGNIIANALARKETMVERRERERKLEQAKRIIENTTAIIYVKDADGRYTLVNSRYEAVLGMDREEILGKTDFEIQSEEYAREVRENDLQAIETGEAIEVEEAAFRNGEIRTYISVKVPIFEDGEPTAVCGISTDITERKRREQELEHKNEQLDAFASLVSHDLRNPLNTLAASLELAEDTGDPGHFDRCRRSIERMDNLLEDLLRLAREGEGIDECEPVALAAAAEEAWQTVETTDSRLVVGTGLTIEADPTRLGQLLENLIDNAVKHGSTDPQSRAREDAPTHGSVVTHPDGDSNGEQNGGVTVEIGDLAEGSGFYVEDDGRGIPEAERDRVLESGYTSVDDGTGFGLSIVQEIVEAHGWEIDVTEGDAGGARFEISGIDSATE